MAVSPRETRGFWHGWRGLVCASLLLTALCGAAAPTQEPKFFFRIGTAATGGSYFEIGGIVASVISRPADAPPCERGGACGVPGLVAVAQATPGSVDNLRLIESGQIESGFAQADLAGWAYRGVKLFAKGGKLHRLRAIASLFPEAVHLVVRAGSPIHSLADLRNKTVSLGQEGSGTAADAEILLAAAGLDDDDVVRRYLRPEPSIEALRLGTLDALFVVGRYPVPAIRNLAAAIPIRLVPIEGSVIKKLKKDFSFYFLTEIPAGSYPGVKTATPTLGFSALWVVNADVKSALVYAITKSLWSKGTAELLDKLDPVGRGIELSRALSGLSIPLHPGAARFYRELGMPVAATPQIAGPPAEGKSAGEKGPKAP